MRASAGVLGAIVFIAAVNVFAASSSAEEGVVTEVLAEKELYLPGEPVNVTVIVTNLGSESITLTFRTGLQAYYVVADEHGDEVFNLTYHATVEMVLTYKTIGAGQSVTYVFDSTKAWDQVDDDENQVPYPGDYTIYGCLNTIYLDSYEKGETALTILSGSESEDVPEFSSVLVVVAALALITLTIRAGRKKTG